MGHLQKTFPVEGGKTYEFTSLRKTEGIDLVRRAGIARLIWLDQNGKRVVRDKPSFASYRPGERPRAEPEFPGDQETESGWTKVAGVYRAPSEAAQVQVELHFRWGPPHSKIQWSNIEFKQTDDIKPRIVRLATIHHQPREGNKPSDKPAQFAKLIEQAAEKKAEPGGSARVHHGLRNRTLLCRVCRAEFPDLPQSTLVNWLKNITFTLSLGLYERAKHLVYNVAVCDRPRRRHCRQVSQSGRCRVVRLKEVSHRGTSIRCLKHVSGKSA